VAETDPGKLYYFQCKKCSRMLKYRIFLQGNAECQAALIPEEELVAAKLREELSTVPYCRFCSGKNAVFKWGYSGYQ
jgi:hypothetical protein